MTRIEPSKQDSQVIQAHKYIRNAKKKRFLAKKYVGAICYLGSFHSETAASAFCLATFTPGPERTVPLFSTSDRGGRRHEATAWTVSALRLDLHLIAILPSPSPSLARASALTIPPAMITPMEALVLCFAAHLSRRTGENTAGKTWSISLRPQTSSRTS
ncbi:hypothetical protein K438DRAFT_1980240 [Mycena galopus ATCC 62051]|nr:hypothetical protein K438DRAFT_1980240 [Mycena galopus ATCC 62051]